MTRDAILAMKPGKELDELVAEKVMGVALHWERPAIIGNRLEWVRCEASTGEIRVTDDGKHVPLYSTEIDAAWAVVDAIHKRGMWMSISTLGPIVHVNADETDERKRALGYSGRPMKMVSIASGESVPHAIVVALLLATLEEQPVG